MPEPFTVGILLGAALLAFRGKGGSPPGCKLPPVDAGDLITLCEWKKTPNGLARYYRLAFIPSIAIQLQSRGVAKVIDEIYKKSRVLVYRLTDSPGTGPNALDIAKIGYESNAAVMVTTNLWLNTGGQSFMAVIPYSQRAIWSQVNRQWAIEFDDQAGETTGTVKTPPKARVPTPKGGSTVSAWDFDANMTDEEKNAAALILSDDGADPDLLDQQAAVFDAAIPPHPKTAKLFRARAKQLRDKLTTPPKWSTPVKDAPPEPDEPVPPIPPDPEIPGQNLPPGVSPDDGAYMSDPSNPVFVYQIQATGVQTPYAIAKRYTGDGNRWREIMPINPRLKEVKVGTVTQVVPWVPGTQMIWLPMAWDTPGVPLATKLPQSAIDADNEYYAGLNPTTPGSIFSKAKA
jgi:hypothetical protein